MEGIKSFLFGDSKSNKVDTQKLRADISSACGIIETVLNIIDILTTEGIHIACQACGKNKKIRNPQNALYVATHHHLNAQSHRYIDHAKKDSKCESPVDIDRSERLKEGREKHSDKLNYPIETKGDDSDDDTKNDTNDDKTDKGNQILKNELIEIKNRLRLAQEEKSCFEKKMKEMEREYNHNLNDAGIELSRLTKENQGCEQRVKDLERKIDQLNNEMVAMKEDISRKEQDNDQLRISLDRKNQTHVNMVSQMNTEQDNLRMELDSLKREVKDAERSTAKKAQEYEKLRMDFEKLVCEGGQKDEKIKLTTQRAEGLEKEIDLKSREIKLTTQRADGLGKEIDLKSIEIKKLNEVVKTLHSEESKKDAKINSLKREVKDAEISTAKKAQEYEKLRMDFEKLVCEGGQKDEKIKLTTQRAEGLEKENDLKSREIKLATQRAEGLEKEIDLKSREIKKLNEVVKTLHSEERKKDAKISSFEERIGDLLSETSSKDRQIDYISAELRTMQRLIEDERKENKSVRASLEEEILGLKADLIAWEERTKKTLVVNFHTSLKQSLALPAQQHIEKCLKEKCQSDKVTLELKQYKSPELTPGPILVLCMNVSRLGTDVKEALKGTPGNYEVLVVVLHHKEVHALPSQASDRVLTGEEYKQLGAIVDAAFWTGRGIYECALNKVATEKIYNFVSGFVTQ